MAKTKIDWTGTTWNPVTGCTKISSGCKFCYAELMAKRLKAMGLKKYRNEFNLTLHPELLKKPYSWKKPRMIFVNSMSDLFHKQVPVDFIRKVIKVIKENPQHIFQVLTKRAELLHYYDNEGWLEWPDNLWMGVTVENREIKRRIDYLRDTNTKVKFISAEPLLTSLGELNLHGIDWMIVGGEGGNKARPMKKKWVIDIREQCRKMKVPFYFKQWGGGKKENSRLLGEKEYNEMPRGYYLWQK